MPKLLQKGINKLNDREKKIAEKTMVSALETRDVDSNKGFIKGALKAP